VRKVKIGRQLDQRKARLLLADDKAQRDQIQRQLTLEQVHSYIAKRVTNDPDNPAASTPTAEEKKEIARHLNATKRHDKYRQA
jgi:hypothetical protein